MDDKVFICEHPLAKHILTLLRAKETELEQFRRLSDRLGTILALEATRDLAVNPKRVETPLEPADGFQLTNPLVIVPVLRAGLGMLKPFVELFPSLEVGFVGLERDEETAEASLYYQKFPDLKKKTVLAVDPMLATGGTLVTTLRAILSQSPHLVKLVCVVAAPEGVKAVRAEFPDIEIYTAALDRELDSQKFIRPGLGDYGDRLLGT